MGQILIFGWTISLSLICKTGGSYAKFCRLWAWLYCIVTLWTAVVQKRVAWRSFKNLILCSNEKTTAYRLSYSQNAHFWVNYSALKLSLCVRSYDWNVINPTRSLYYTATPLESENHQSSTLKKRMISTENSSASSLSLSLPNLTSQTCCTG